MKANDESFALLRTEGPRYHMGESLPWVCLIIGKEKSQSSQKGLDLVGLLGRFCWARFNFANRCGGKMLHLERSSSDPDPADASMCSADHFAECRKPAEVEAPCLGKNVGPCRWHSLTHKPVSS